MRIVLLVIGLLGINTSMALAQSWNGSYYCVGEAAGGLSYDTTTKQWKGAVMRPDEKFVLRLEYISRREQPEFEQPVEDYKVAITRSGKSSGLLCLRRLANLHFELFVGISRDGEMEECFIGEIYRFNLKHGRFLRIHGGDSYLHGNDDSSTPSIEAGACTKID
jgi:hypothetical protein